MKNRIVPRLVVALVALTAIAVSCSLDYRLWFEIDAFTITGITNNTVEVDYTITNQGSRSLENATITIRVTCTVLGYGTQVDTRDSMPVDLFIGESDYGTLTFTFDGEVSNVVCEVVAAGWDEPSPEE